MKYINRSNVVEPSVAISPIPVTKLNHDCHTVYYRVAGMLGANGPYVLTATSLLRETEIQNSPNFKQWLTLGKQQTFWA